MASNKELIKTAGELAEELGISIETEGLNNKELSDLVKDLRAKVADASTETQAETAGAKVEEATEVIAGYIVADGVSLTSPKGIIESGAPIEDGLYSDETIEDLKTRKLIKKA